MQTLELTVRELDCADEARQIQSALGRLPGVTDVRTAVAARKAIVVFDPARVTPESIREAVRRLGMTVTDPQAASGRQRPLGDLLGWAFASIVALAALVGLAGEWLGFAEALSDRIPSWLVLMAILIGGYPIFRNVVRALLNRAVTSHALMTLGILGAISIGQYAAGAVIVFFMRLADFVESYTTERSRHAIKELLRLAPDLAQVERSGVECEVPADQVVRGEVVLVKPGGRIPVDGAVIDGHASVNQAPITGESMPVEKRPGDRVYAATICERGALRVCTERAGPDTTFGQIIRLVEEAEASKAPVQRFADRFTSYYIPVVLGVAGITYFASGNAVAAVATVLVACSCAIAMATPITVLAAVGWAAGRGIVIKGGRYLEALAKVDTIVMDKTGTLTVGRPEVTDVVALGDTPASEILRLSGALERRSEHPLADGIVRAASRKGIVLDEPKSFEVYPGTGVAGMVGGRRVWCGTEALIARADVVLPREVEERIGALALEGKSVAIVASDGNLLGLIALADTLRPEVPAALEGLRRLGIQRLLLLSGDRHQVAGAVARQLGLDFQADVLPEGKIRAIAELQRQGHVVAMVGDGINDAPALAQADVGIAMGAAGTDAAIEAAHVALMRDDWLAVPEAVSISRRAFRTIQQNLWFTAAYNVVGMLLAATGLLPPVAAAAAQSLPDVVVMLNSSRLLRRHGRGDGMGNAPGRPHATG